MFNKIFRIMLFVLWAVPVSGTRSEVSVIDRSAQRGGRLTASDGTACDQVDTAWVRRYNGPGNGLDEATAIAVDNSANVYVTGYSSGSGTNWDYVTIKYYPGGDTAWLRRYNGPGNGLDKADGIAVDNSGNVYVTGYSLGFNETGDDYATIKYDSSGKQLWVSRYDGPGDYYTNNDDGIAIAVDNSGNVYVTGFSIGDTGQDYATIKYYPDGDTAWVRRYNENGRDIALAITVDDSGNVYVTGTSGTIKYSANGDQLWVGAWGGVNIALDSYYNVYVCGGIEDYATIKYHPNGDIAWERTYNGPDSSSDVAKALTVDDSDNIYVTGGSIGSGTSYDYATIKYYPNGDTTWVRRYNGAGNGDDKANAIAVDDSGNVYVTGASKSNGTSYDYVTIKYYPSGDTAWVKRYNGSGDSVDQASAIAVDNSRNVYVTGWSLGSGTESDYATIKYFKLLRGDINKNGVVELGDIVYLQRYIYRNGPAPDPLCLGDVNCDDKVDLGDMVYLITYLYKNGPPPC